MPSTYYNMTFNTLILLNRQQHLKLNSVKLNQVKYD